MSLFEELQIEIPDFEDSSVNILKGEVDSNNLESFYPIAEVFLGKRREELPGKKVYFLGKKKKKRNKK
jgi:hypothetical protein